MNRPVACATGHYCPGVPHPGDPRGYYKGEYVGFTTSYAKQYPCEPGTYTNSTSLWNQTQCSICPAGSYCSGGEATPSGLCSKGFYCPERSYLLEQVPCPAGTYNDLDGQWKESQCKV